MAKVEMPCEECGKKTYKWPNQAAARKYGVFCTMTCLGKFRTKILVRDKAANFKFGWSLSKGYISAYVPWHPKAKDNGHYDLHRLLIEFKLERILDFNEVVHHKDGDSMNNHWDNLELLSREEHSRQHTATYERDKKGRINAKKL